LLLPLLAKVICTPGTGLLLASSTSTVSETVAAPSATVLPEVGPVIVEVPEAGAPTTKCAVSVFVKVLCANACGTVAVIVLFSATVLLSVAVILPAESVVPGATKLNVLPLPVTARLMLPSPLIA
jgi:hypothetical protein